MGRFKFTATVTNPQSGERKQISDTATVDDPFAGKHEAAVAIGKELNRQGTPGTNITVTRA